MINIRRAKESESCLLSNIAVKSEAYWGYDSDFMEKFKTIYKVTEEFISKNLTFVIEDNNNIIGFYAVLNSDKEISLEYFYIDPDSIGKGHGKLLWEHMVSICKENAIKEIVLVTSPQAKEFYIKMGAVQSGEVESLILKGRKIPRLVYVI